MLTLARAGHCVPSIAAIALVLSFGMSPAKAGESSVWDVLERPDEAFVSGLQDCGSAHNDGTSEGTRCLMGWSVNRLVLDGLTHFANEHGEAVFGDHFRVVNNLSYSPFGDELSGGLDVVLPLASSTVSGSEWAKSNALFLQQGVTRWVDELGVMRNDIRVGAVRRFGLSEEGAASNVVGVSTFVQKSREFQHTRLVMGTDYAGQWGRGSLNVFVPTTGWLPAHPGYEERALTGVELGLRFDLTTTLSSRTAIGQWEDTDGLGGWSTNGRIALGWRPHSWLHLSTAWDGLGTDSDERAFRLAFSMPLGATRRPPEWEGLGLVGGASAPAAVDPWSPVENIDAIQVARREITPERLVSEATVRFLQESASTGDEIGLEVLLSQVTPRDLSVVVILAPGTGDNPAVPGVDFSDEHIPVTISAGRSSGVVTVQLPLNADLDESRCLQANVALPS